MRILLSMVLAVSVLMSCEFKETMTIDEAGKGRISLQVDLGTMMSLGGEMSSDSTLVKQDTIIAFKDFLVEKRDSIVTLPMAEQERLKALENYKLHMLVDPDKNQMLMDFFIDFNDISEANNLLEGFNKIGALMPTNGAMSGTSDEKEPQIVGVRYTYKPTSFVRDAYIIDEAAHQTQIDSMEQATMFLSDVDYVLAYTFPKKIKSASIKDATFSLDGKTIEIRKPIVDYMKNPDLLDLEVEFEN